MLQSVSEASSFACLGRVRETLTHRHQKRSLIARESKAQMPLTPFFFYSPLPAVPESTTAVPAVLRGILPGLYRVFSTLGRFA
jgi:hypothetical protein